MNRARKSLRGSGSKKNLKTKKKQTKESNKEQNVYFDMEMEPIEMKMVPDNQLQLTEAELDEEFTKTLTSIDPKKAAKITNFNFKHGAFESFPNTDHIAVHMCYNGIIWSKKEEELIKLQMQKEEEQKKENVEKTEKDANQETENSQPISPEKEEQEKKEKLVKNQFNFSDRASQTFNQPMRDRDIQIEPAPKSVFCQTANPWVIRDEYLNNLLKEKQQKADEENKKKNKANALLSKASTDKKSNGNDGDDLNDVKHHNEGDALLHSKNMLKALKIMERVTVLNANSKSYHDFRYYSEENGGLMQSKRKKKATLSHLWSFKYSALGKNKMVTDLCWNSGHNDLFAVSFGSYSFDKQTSGVICIYSLKSTAFPEKIIHSESGIMCLSFHAKHPSLLCCGCYDGSVAVYDIRNRDDTPIYCTENPQSFHSDPVWDVEWYLNDLFDHELSFYSISSDSKIKIWKMSQNELTHSTLIELKNPTKNAINNGAGNNDNSNSDDDDRKDDKDNMNADDDEDDLALCSCIDFKPEMSHLYLIGTEDGYIFESSKTGSYSKAFDGHDQNVYAVKWNPFDSSTFISCSQDWTVKLWDSSDPHPIISYDLNCAVNDIAWAPYSSTIFGAVTNDGRVHVWDLSQNKNYPLCSEKLTKKNIALTKVSFPRGFPLIIVGDEKGNVFALKLSRNLYVSKKDEKNLVDNLTNDVFKQKEKQKLQKVLNVTGTKVLDLVQHLSPKKFIIRNKKLLSSPDYILKSPKMSS